MDQFYFCPPLLQQALKEVSTAHKDDDKNQKRKSNGADDRKPKKYCLMPERLQRYMENKTIEQKVAAMDSFLQVIVDQDFKFPAIPERLKEKFPDDMKEVIVTTSEATKIKKQQQQDDECDNN